MGVRLRTSFFGPELRMNAESGAGTKQRYYTVRLVDGEPEICRSSEDDHCVIFEVGTHKRRCPFCNSDRCFANADAIARDGEFRYLIACRCITSKRYFLLHVKKEILDVSWDSFRDCCPKCRTSVEKMSHVHTCCHLPPSCHRWMDGGYPNVHHYVLIANRMLLCFKCALLLRVPATGSLIRSS
jgi:hypothetical protein